MNALQDQMGSWIPQVQGQYINMDGAYGAQCWDLSAHWSNFLGLPIINTGGSGRWPGWAGNMVDAFPQSGAIAAAYTLHGPGTTGQAGDIVVWDDSYWYYPATHVAVLIADKGNQLQCMSQNSTPARADNPYPGSSSGPTTIQALPRQGLMGFIRPRVGSLSYQGGTVNQTTNSTTEDIDMASAAEILARQTEHIAWEDQKFTQLRAEMDSNRNALAGWVRDLFLSGESVSEAELDAKLAELTSATRAAVGVRLYKSLDPNNPDVYVLDQGSGPRHINLDEYRVLLAGGGILVEVDPEIMDRITGNAVGGK